MNNKIFVKCAAVVRSCTNRAQVRVARSHIRLGYLCGGITVQDKNLLDRELNDKLLIVKN